MKITITISKFIYTYRLLYIEDTYNGKHAQQLHNYRTLSLTLIRNFITIYKNFEFYTKLTNIIKINTRIFK